MFDRLTDRALKTMGLARQEAQNFNHDYIGTEHILLGLIQVGGVAAVALKKLDVDPARVGKEVEKLITHGTTMVTMGHIPFTPGAKKVLELALEEASNLGHDFIGAEHLLLGLIREEKGIAAQALDTLGVRLENTRAAVLGAEASFPAIRDRSHMAPATRGSGLFDRFTDRARKVLGLARQEAQRFNHDYIGTEHILLGLIQEGSGVAADVLKNLDVDPKRVRQETERLLGPGTTMVTSGLLPFTQRAMKVLDLALEEANNLGHNYIGTEHLLLGLIREQEGIAAQVLQNLNVRFEDAREEVLELLGAEGSGQETEWAGKLASVYKTRVPEVSGPLTDRARRVLRIAADEAARFRHREIGTEHLLLGLIGEVAPGILSKILLRRLRMDTERLMTPGTEPVAGPPGFTPAARKAIELALRTAHDLAQGGAGPEDLLLGLIGEREGIAARVLAAAGITGEELRDSARSAEPPPPRVKLTGLSYSDRFAGRHAMQLAWKEAHRLGHDFIGTEHALLGLVAADGDGANLLRRLGVVPARVRAATEERITPGKATLSMGQLPFTPRMKRVLEAALEEANALGADSIREEHVLLGLVREEEGIAAQALLALGVTLDAVRKALGPPAPPE